MASTRLPHGFNMSVLHACQYVVASELNTKLSLLTVLISIGNSKLLCEMHCMCGHCENNINKEFKPYSTVV